uniref:Secreted protein n=1 Tax=Steinernema glaseri TaxID=37863 RepID=A0A1I7ZH87_9BILA
MSRNGRFTGNDSNSIWTPSPWMTQKGLRSLWSALLWCLISFHFVSDVVAHGTPPSRVSQKLEKKRSLGSPRIVSKHCAAIYECLGLLYLAALSPT